MTRSISSIMPGYDRERVARRFDELLDDASTGLKDGVAARVGEAAFRALELSEDDVLLDVGTGTGVWAIRAARLCRRVIGIDISRESLRVARERARSAGLENVLFARGSFENPCEEVDLRSAGITKILALYSLHHLPDAMKAEALGKLVALLRPPGRLVVGDIIFFENPEEHRDRFEEVGYDGGILDFPTDASFLAGVLESLGAEVRVVRLHPLAGVICALVP